jgi:hypothetical protein
MPRAALHWAGVAMRKGAFELSSTAADAGSCRCTLALNLPNVCVYPDSTLKFHLAYDPHNHEVNSQVSQQLVSSYPASVQARLGILKRKYKVLRGSELIALGIRDCNAPKSNEPKIMVAAAAPEKPPRAVEPNAQMPLFAGMFGKMLSVFGVGEAARARPRAPPLRYIRLRSQE